MSLRVAAVVAMVGVGCGIEVEPRWSGVEQDILTCDEFMCGTNSPQIAQFGFWELNQPPALGTLGKPNNVGLQVEAFVLNGVWFLPKVSGGRLTASKGSNTLAGPELVNGWLQLRNRGRTFRMRVVEVGQVASWAQPPAGGPPVMVESYRLDWSELVNGNWGDSREVCKNPPGRDNDDALTMTGPYVFHTLMFEGDRIEPSKKTDYAIDESWFNLGCAGHALAKLALTGHTQGAHNAGTFHTTLAERQTMLKMLAADYCGDGTPFTVAGQPLNWRDDHNTMKLAALLVNPPQPLVLESRWTADGAACLDKPRVDVHWTQLGDQVFGSDVYAQVQSHCPAKMPPSCADSSFDTAGYHLLTATVPFQP